jgi:uncharacterized phage-associated protein
MYDPRAIANLVLDAAERYDFKVSNLKLQKLLFFAHGKYLIEHGQPLTKGSFEAWQHGPVHPVVYQAFKSNEGNDILDRAERFDPVSRKSSSIPLPKEPSVLIVVDKTVLEFGRMSAGRLRGLTHSKGGPWDTTMRRSENASNLGLRIKDEVIVETFSSQLMIVRDIEEGTEPRENAPYS